MINWEAFKVKSDKKETHTFEQLSYLLFCAELDERVGLFRYKNQTGIETEPLEVDGVICGFQAKYYTTSISDNKDDIIDSLRKAKSKNPNLQKIYLYLNQELSESSKKGKKTPVYQDDIESVADEIGVTLSWRVPSYFELQLTNPENKYIYDLFFSLGLTDSDFYEQLVQHNQMIFNTIHNEIVFEQGQIQIDRSIILQEILTNIQNHQNIILSGEGGSGKTAIVKELYYQNHMSYPIFIFKSSELNTPNINNIFSFECGFTFTQFLSLFKNETVKLFVIDSAEKLADLEHTDVLVNLIRDLKKNGWVIIFTTRYSYLNDLVFHINENYHLPCTIKDIPLITQEYLLSLSEQFHFPLPAHTKFTERLRNLFYLREYVQHLKDINKSDEFKKFIDLLWKKKIQNNSIQKNNLHIERERCLIAITKQRCQTGAFYVNVDNLSSTALFHLKHDEILDYSDAHDGYFITHDIYEEWALSKIILRCYANLVSVEQFFSDLGESLPMRRAFRIWLSDFLSESPQIIKPFIQEVFTDDKVEKFWKDEILVSVLLSDYAKEFFREFKQEMIVDDGALLKRVIFLLKIACIDVSINQANEVTQPKGSGWKEIISFIYDDQSNFFFHNFKIVLPLLDVWSKNYQSGETTRYIGMLALSLLEKSETDDNYCIRNNEVEIFQIIFNSSYEIRKELIDIFELVIANKRVNGRSTYVEFCKILLTKPYLAIYLLKDLPQEVIKICSLFWQEQIEESQADDIWTSYRRDTMEKKYGLSTHCQHKYSPLGANQTPIKWLLQFAFHETLDFIINFTNTAVEKYSYSNYGQEGVIKVDLSINGKETIQYLDESLWNMYRGTGSPVVPYLLSSIHMALERVLLDYAKFMNSKEELYIFRKILMKILSGSKSASLTAVVTSIVLAYPNKFYDIALILFGSIELFNVDAIRCLKEAQAKSLYSIGSRDQLSYLLYGKERLDSCNEKHRKINLELLFLHYQWHGVSGFTEEQNSEFINKLYELIDTYKNNSSINNNFGILLARMDRRNLSIQESKQEENKLCITLRPKNLPVELQEQSDEAVNKFNDLRKYSSLRLWSDFLANFNKNEELYAHYDKNPQVAFNEMQLLIKDLESGREGLSDYTIPAFVCSKLVVYHMNSLNEEAKKFCKEEILSTVKELLSDNYHYQVGDGVEAAIHALPFLLDEFPDENDIVILLLILTLFDTTSLGAYKRICDYAIESIHRSNLWSKHKNIAQSILYGYIGLKPLYKKIYSAKQEALRKSGDWSRITQKMILDELIKTDLDYISNHDSFDIQQVNLLDFFDLEIVLQLIPSDTEELMNLTIYEIFIKDSLPLLLDRANVNKISRDDGSLYLVRLNIFARFSHFILHRKKEDIDRFLQPIIISLDSSEEVADLIKELILAEDTLNHNVQFWHIWDEFYPRVKELCIAKSRNHYTKNIIINYLLASNLLASRIPGWHSLKKENLYLYKNASQDMGGNPSTLYSIVRVLNSIGANFLSEGIDWIHSIICNNEQIDLGDLKKNTFCDLEKIMKKFIFANKQKIRQEVRLKKKVIAILGFMIERGSTHGYLLRESIL